MLTSIQSYGSNNYESYNIKIPSEVVQKEESKQQPRLDSNSLVDPIIESVADESKKVSEDSATDSLINKQINIKKEILQQQDNYNQHLSQRRNQSYGFLGTTLDITI
jgi:hypothetical protein